MPLFKKTLTGALALSISEVANQACSLARNIILARFLAKDDFGVAALLGMILTLFELASKLALGQQVVQSKLSDTSTFFDSIHFTQLALGVASAVLILIGAWPLSRFFAGSDHLGSIAILALIPLINGLCSLDCYYQTRRLVFLPLVLVETIPQVITTLAVWPLALWFGDYRAVLAIMLARALASTVLSHWLSQRRYAPRFVRDALLESLKFGWPLLAAGFIRFGNFQGDSMVVASVYNLGQLAEFSIATTIAMTPGLSVIRIANSVWLPILSEAQSDLAELTRRYKYSVESMALLACVAMIGMFFCGKQLIVLIFGEKYSEAGTLATWLMAGQALRIVRGATNGVAMARSDTLNSMISNAWRLTGLGLAIIIGALNLSLIWFAVAALTGEALALWASVAGLKSKHGMKPATTLLPTAAGIGCVCFAIAVERVVPLKSSWIVNWASFSICSLVSCAVFLVCFPALRYLASVSFTKMNSRIQNRLPWQPSKSLQA